MPTKHEMVSLSEHAAAIILGSLLGDGSIKIHPGYANARFSFRHSSTQSDYFYWKASQLREIAGEKSVFEQKPDGYSKVPKLLFRSQALPSLTEIYQLTHDQHSFRIKRRWLNKMDALSLATWWCDDGSLVTNTRKGVFCTDGFDEKSVKLLARYLQIEWGIKTIVGAIHKEGGLRDQYFRLWIRSTDELKKFLRLVAPHVPKSMLYKVLILYKDSELQQRWISEIADLTEFSIEEISEIVNERKDQLKHYQKKI
jgi:LAGLIDADG DNA endonuclease family